MFFSVQVYPVAGLIHYAQRGIPVYLIDPKNADAPSGVIIIRDKASTGMARLKDEIRKTGSLYGI